MAVSHVHQGRIPHRWQSFANSPIFAYGILLFTMFLWASAFAGIRFVLSEISPMALTVARLNLAAIVLLFVGIVARVPLPRRQDLGAISAAALLGFALYHFGLNLGTASISAGQSSFIVATIPMWTALFAARFLRERLYWWTVLGIAMGIAGVAFMSLNLHEARLSTGSIFVLAATICASGNIAMMKYLLLRYSALQLSVYTTLLGSLPLLIFLPSSWQGLSEMSPAAWWVTLYLAIGPIALGYWLSSVALARLPASRTAQMLLLIPPMSAVIAWLTIDELPDQKLFIGGPMILLGVLIGNASFGRKPKSTTARAEH